jgi:hypothetical protein
MGWHAKCYVPRAKDNFPIVTMAAYEIEDDEQVELKDEKEETKFKYARLGDNFMCPFQCDLCHYRNMKGENPGKNPNEDLRLMVGIRRAILDSFWGRAEATVANNFRDVKKLKDIGISVGLENLLPEMGPFALEDEWGMGIAVGMLYRSLDSGLYRDTLQFSSTRKLRSAFSNLWGSSVHSMTRGVMAKDTIKTFVTKCPTYSLWFERFVKGMHSRMGDDRRPDAAISTEVMHAVIKRVNIDFIESTRDFDERYYARAGLLFLGAYLGSLRGEEIPRILRKHFIQLNKDSMNRKVHPHGVLPLYGQFKGEQGIARCYIRRVSLETKSGFKIGIWIKRVSLLEANARTKYLFAKPNGTKEKGGEYEDYLFDKLRQVQNEEDGLISSKVKVEEIFGVGRSFRRGSTTAATNAPNNECTDADIIRNNRWRKEERAGTKMASLDMLQLYTDTIQSVNADLKFSKCL